MIDLDSVATPSITIFKHVFRKQLAPKLEANTEDWTDSEVTEKI